MARWLVVWGICLGVALFGTFATFATGPHEGTTGRRNEGPQVTTIRGIAQPTKDGLYVNGVVVAEEVLPKGWTVEALAGKMVEIKGTVRTTTHVEQTEPQSQHRSGTWQYMEQVESVKVIPVVR